MLETLVIAPFVALSVGNVPYPEAVKFVEETDAKVDCPVIFAVAIWRFPVPVAFVKVNP